MEEIQMGALKLGGNSSEEVNRWAVLIVGGVMLCSLLGLGLDFALKSKLQGPPSSRPRCWVLGMLVSCYGLLRWGLFDMLFSYKIAAVDGMFPLSERSENMIDFARELSNSGSHLGTIAVVGFAIVIPAVKLVLLIAGGLMRHSKDEGCRTFARSSIHFVQKISKWASPDMFAYILLLYLIRGLDHPPTLNGLMELDIGFTCFSTFCVASTISSLGVRAPDGQRVRRWICPCSTFVVVSITVLISIGFIVSMVLGLLTPCMSLRLDIDALFESGQLNRKYEAIVRLLNVGETAAADVDLWSCMRKLWGWILQRNAAGNIVACEVNSLISFTMIAAFVVLFTILDMATLLLAAVLLNVHGYVPEWILGLTHIFRKLSMLDVAITGVVVVVLVGGIYKKLGVVLSTQRGIYYLLMAESCHYVSYYLVTLTASLTSELEDSLSSSSEPEGLGKDVDHSTVDEEDTQYDEISTDEDLLSR